MTALGKFKELDIEIQDAVEDLKKLRGLAPYNQPSNIVYGDARFANSLKYKYSAEAMSEAEDRLDAETIKLTINITPEQQEILTNLIIEERCALRGSREYCEDDEVEENDQAYDDLGDLFEEITGHDLERSTESSHTG